MSEFSSEMITTALNTQQNDNSAGDAGETADSHTEQKAKASGENTARAPLSQNAETCQNIATLPSAQASFPGAGYPLANPLIGGYGLNTGLGSSSAFGYSGILPKTEPQTFGYGVSDGAQNLLNSQLSQTSLDVGGLGYVNHYSGFGAQYGNSLAGHTVVHPNLLKILSTTLTEVLGG